MTGVTGFGEKEFMSCAELSSLELCCLKEKVLSYSLEVYYYYYSQKPSNIKNMLQSIYYDIFENFDFAVDSDYSLPVTQHHCGVQFLKHC